MIVKESIKLKSRKVFKLFTATDYHTKIYFIVSSAVFKTWAAHWQCSFFLVSDFIEFYESIDKKYILKHFEMETETNRGCASILRKKRAHNFLQICYKSQVTLTQL